LPDVGGPGLLVYEIVSGRLFPTEAECSNEGCDCQISLVGRESEEAIIEGDY